MKTFSKIRNEAYADMLSRKEKLHNRSNDAYKKGDLPTMHKAHSLAMKQNKRIQAKYPDEDANRIMSGASKDYQGGRKYTGDSVEYPEDTNVIGEGERGLWDNIHAKRKRIKAGSGERMRKPGSKGAPTAKALRVSAESTQFDEYSNGVAEATGDVKFDKMLKGITNKKEVAKQQKTDTKQQARDAFSGMFGGGNPADKLSIRKKGVTANEDHTKNDTPFDGPYKKTSGDGTVKDKSGAVHTPMSRVKHLARQAMKQQMKEDIDLFFEDKDKEEYDYEGDMARGQLQSIINNAQRVHDMLEDNTNIAEWVQSKITLAEDYISTVANYMMSEIDEAKKMKGEDPCWDNYKMIGTKNKGGKQVPNCVPEEVEHTDESRQVYYINSHKNQDPAVAQAKRIRNKMAKPKMLNLKMGEAYSARDRLAMALNNEKKKREEHEAAQAARESAKKMSQQTAQPEQKIKEGIASLISNNIKKVTATKPTPQQKADIRLNK